MSSLFEAWAMTLPSFTQRSLSSLENSTSTHSLLYLFLISSRRINGNFRLLYVFLRNQTLTDKDCQQLGKRRWFDERKFTRGLGFALNPGRYRIQLFQRVNGV